VVNRKRLDLKMVALKNQSRFDLQHIQGHRRLVTSQHNAIDQIADAVHRMAAAVNVNLFNGFPAHKGREQACQTENMIKVSVRQQDMVQPLKPTPDFRICRCVPSPQSP